MRKLIFLAAFVLLGQIQGYAAAPPVPAYSLTDIGVLPGFTETVGNSINKLGEVAGYCDSFTFGSTASIIQHGFVYRRGKLIDIGALYNPSLSTTANFVNIKGDVILTYQVPHGDVYPALYRNGRFTNLTFPKGGKGVIAGLNDFGQVAGNYNTYGANTSSFFAFIIQPNGTSITLPAYGPIGSQGVIAVTGITECGRVYGMADTAARSSPQSEFNIAYAVITHASGPPVNLGTFNDGSGNLLVNNLGHFVVVPAEALGNVPPVLHVGAKTINLPPIIGAYEYYDVTGINDFDTVVGWGLAQASNISTPYLYIHGTIYDPNTLVSPLAPSVHLFKLLGVNDAGQILASGAINPGPFGALAHTYILNPRGR